MSLMKISPLSLSLENNLKGTSKRKLEVMGDNDNIGELRFLNRKILKYFREEEAGSERTE